MNRPTSQYTLPRVRQINHSMVRVNRRERGIWQRRYWEHLVRDEVDYRAHMDYVHINPLKRGLVTRVQDWPHSTFHKWVEAGVYPIHWCGDAEANDLDYPE